MNKVPHTRIFDELVPEFGLVGAAVFGVIWRYAQMRDGTCHAAYETLATDIGVNERTMRRKVEDLQKAKLIQLHHRKNGGPYWISICADIESDRTESPVATSERTESPDRPDRVSGTDRTESPIRKPNKRPVKKPKKATPSRKRKRAPFWNDDQKVLADHFSEVSGLAIPKLEGAYAAVTKSWKLPLSEMFELVGSVTEAKHLIAQTVREMRAAKLRISAPRSIWNVALDIHAKGATNSEPASYQAIREGLGLLRGRND